MQPAVNSRPLSQEISSSTPNVAKKEQRWRKRPAAPARVVPAGEPNTFTHPGRRSPITNYWLPPVGKQVSAYSFKWKEGEGRGDVLPMRAHFWDPLCSVSLRRWLSNVSITVSCTMMCYEIVPSSWVSLWIDTISADSTWSGMLMSGEYALFEAEQS